jgi:IS66 Orf2 like protein
VNLLAQIVAHKRDFILHRQSNCGINYFTYAAKISLQLIGALSSPVRGEACHEASKLHQVRYREQRSFLPHGDFRIRLAHIGPLRGNGAEALVVDAQQETLAGAVIALANADELPATEWMERDELCGQAASRYQQGLHSELCYKRLERGRFVWPLAQSGKVHLTQAQLSMLLEGINWKQPERTWEPMTVL